jgi:MFS family permease
VLSTVRAARALPPVAKLLLVNQFGVYVGFYLLIPYLAVHLREDLGLTAATVGAVIGVRSLCQQGMTVFGGSAADRLGCRPLILAGCALRAVGFASFAVFNSVAGLFVASMLTGLAGAVFSPAARAYLAHEAAERRLLAFSLLNVAGEAGTFLGPLLGSLLLMVDFRVVAVAAGAVFAVLTVAQLFALPPRAPEPARQPVWSDWREVVTNRRYVRYTVAASGIFVLYNQLYLTLPLEAGRVTGVSSTSAVLFTASTVITLGFQVRITEWCQRRFATGTSLVIGLAVCAAAFLVPLVCARAQPTVAARPHTDGLLTALAQWPHLVPTLLATMVLTVGVAIAQPFSQHLVPAFGRAGLTGTYLGAFATVSGAAAMVVNTAVGYASDIAGPWLSWLLLAGYGAGCAVLLLAMYRRNALPALSERDTSHAL